VLDVDTGGGELFAQLRPPPGSRSELEMIEGSMTSSGFFLGSAPRLGGCLTHPQAHYLDIRAVVYQLRAIPRQVPTFDPEHHRDHLLSIQAEILASGSFTVTSHRILLMAVRDE
jgi:hypothetical protein